MIVTKEDYSLKIKNPYYALGMSLKRITHLEVFTKDWLLSHKALQKKLSFRVFNAATSFIPNSRKRSQNPMY